jgi:hypothetical protein
MKWNFISIPNHELDIAFDEELRGANPIEPRPVLGAHPLDGFGDHGQGEIVSHAAPRSGVTA